MELGYARTELRRELVRRRCFAAARPRRRASMGKTCWRRWASAGSCSTSTTSRSRWSRRAEVRVVRAGDVDLDFARDEGEGFESVADWRAAHERFWHDHEITDDTLIVAERFKVVERLRVSADGDRAGSRACRLAERGAGGGPRPRGPPRHLPQHADHARRSRSAATSSTGRARSRARSTRGAATRRARSASRRRWGRTTSVRRSTATWACTSSRGVEPWRIFAKYMGRADGPTRGRDGNVHMADSQPRADRDGQPSAGDAAGRRRLRARLPDPRGEARRGRLVRRGRLRARRRARGDEPRRRPPAAGGLHLRQQPVGVLDADAPRVRRPSTSPTAPQAYGFEGVVVDGTDVLAVYREAKRAIEKARDGRRADADRVPDAAHGGPRRPRRRLLRPEGHVRGVGEERPDRALPRLAARERRPVRRGGGRDRRRHQEAPQRRDQARRGVAAARPVDADRGVYATPEELDTPHHK